MKKLFLILVLVIVAFSFSVFVFRAYGDENLSLEETLEQIMSSQGAETTAAIKCQEVTNEQFEELGEAVMGLMHPGEREHELMDRMMGGEGSESLRAMHILMGQRYLGCVSGMMSGMDGMMGMGGIMNMMSGGMMGNWSNPNNSMMANMMNFGSWGAWGWLGFIFMILFWVLIVVGVIALIVWLVKQIRGETKSKSALDLLKERYAKGEISKKEFEEKKRDLI